MRRLKELFLYPLTGLWNEFHRIDLASLRDTTRVEPDGKFCLRSLNNLWWREALSRPTIESIVERMRDRYRVVPPASPQHRAVLADPDAFIEAVREAPEALANLAVGARGAFVGLETLQIFCSLYSDFISAPHTLSLQEGLVVNELSSQLLAQESLNPVANPYLPFLQRHVAPVLQDAQPDLVWIVGPIKMSTFAMAMMARQVRPDCHITVTGHSTEYYSLNKITKYLKKNTVLFSVIDSIILDDFENTESQLVNCLWGGHPLDTVPNLLYAGRLDRSREDSRPAGSTSLPLLSAKGGDDGPVKETPMLGGRQTLGYHTHAHPVSIPPEDRRPGHVDPSQVVDAKLWPNAKCYWDQCNFCAINRKYQTLPKNSFLDAEQVADYMADLAQRGVGYVWSFDEAIPPKTLGELAAVLIRKGVQITWQTRSKIDKHFTPEICQALGQSGLREIRLGLESASPRVLSTMGKFPADWSLQLIEQVVSYFHAAGVSVHFPTIIGFPTETAGERAETYAFLRYITDKYPSVTFNMNVLGFDIGSKLFEQYEDFGITSIRWPVPAKFFLGNLLDWDCAEVPFDYAQCDRERNDLMRRLLYPWMPTTALVPPYIYYRLSETSRATMVWKAARQASGNWRDDFGVIDRNSPLTVSQRLVVSKVTTAAGTVPQRYFVYDWGSHHNFECDAEGVDLLGELRRPGTVQEVVARLHGRRNGTGSPEEAARVFGPQIEQLYRMGIVRHETRSCERAGDVIREREMVPAAVT